MDYEIAIPSYQRAETLRDKTMVALREAGYDPQRVTVFVADEQERLLYENTLDSGSYREIVVGVPGMGAIRNFMQMHYPEGTRILFIDDDIKQIVMKVDDKTMVPIPSIDQLVQEGFTMASQAGARLWGIYPVCNAMFMKHRVRTDLSYICGNFWGWVNSHDTAVSVELDDKEDFERTIKCYLADGAVVRLDYYTTKTRYYAEPGGMQVERTADRVTASAHHLLARYPQLCQLNTRKKAEWTEIKLRDTRPRA